MTQQNQYRLPRNIRPYRYELSIEPDLQSASFSGSVIIHVDVERPTKTVILNAAELDITQCSFVQENRIEASNLSFDSENERVTIEFSENLTSGTASINCHFDGILNDKLRGFYRSTYSDQDGNEHTIATTQFESTNARRAFPCFDEPDFKATFEVDLIVNSDLMAISCGELTDSVDLGDGRRRDSFAPTMSMSTYLVAFIIGDLEATEPIDVDGVPLRIIHVPGKAELTAFGLEAGEFSLRWLVDYYGIDYPAGKLDLVAVPDFAFGAMENLGCVTFRETLLLADPGRSTQAELTRIVDVIAHEIAHMWFGNLVTMDWWNGIWLKEAFATFMQVATTNAFKPEWRRWDSFSLEKGAAFDTDALSSTRPIEFEVVSPEDAEGMYDILTYEKGASVVRMLEQFLGESNFRKGVNNYLITHSYKNTTTTDLWDALEESTATPVRAAMDSWIFQGGHPVISVASSADGIRLHQRQFSYAQEPSNKLWHVPIIIKALVNGSLVEQRLLLAEETTDVSFDFRPTWVIVNAGGHGFYRVSYDNALLADLSTRALDVASASERYGLVNDTFASVLAGEVSATDFITLVTNLASETDLGVWQKILASLGQLHSIADADGRTRLSILVRDLSTTALGILGFEAVDGEPALDRELRSLLFLAAGTIGKDTLAITQANEFFDAQNSGKEIEPNLAAAAVTIAATNGDAETYDCMLQLFRDSVTPQEELRYFAALLEFRQVNLFDATLELVLTELRTQNAPFMLASAITHLDHGARAWTFLKTNWDLLCQKFPQNSIPRMVGGIRAISDPALAAEIKEFFAHHPVPQGVLTVAQHLEKMEMNVSLRSREGSSLGAIQN